MKTTTAQPTTAQIIKDESINCLALTSMVKAGIVSDIPGTGAPYQNWVNDGWNFYFKGKGLKLYSVMEANFPHGHEYNETETDPYIMGTVLRKTEVKLKHTFAEKLKATVYATNSFMGNITKEEVYLNAATMGKYAQYDNVLSVIYTPKGKRTQTGRQCTYEPYLLVVEGWGHPEPDDLFNEGKMSESGLLVREGRYRSFDKAFKTDFDKIIEKHLAACKVIIDIRTTAGTKIINL